MSAQVTEAHRQIARCIGRGTAGEYPQDVEHDAQLIANSEAKATEQANAQVESLLSAAKNAIPASEHPAEPTVQNWAWQIRNLGDDRRLVYAQRDQLRAKNSTLCASQKACEACDEPTAFEVRQLRAALAAATEECTDVRLKWHSVMGTCDAKEHAIIELDEELACLRARAEHAEAKLAAEREKVRVLQEAMKFSANKDKYFQAQFDPCQRASAALDATEGTK